jgi:hypothetical protein
LIKVEDGAEIFYTDWGSGQPAVFPVAVGRDRLEPLRDP